MTKPSKKEQLPAKPTIKVTRTRTGGKADIDLFARLKQAPEYLHPIEELVTQPTQPNTENTTHTTHTTQQLEFPISPIRDFTKVANSVFRKAPELFKGLTERTYDVLYKNTRGAIIPKRLVQLKKGELCRLTGLSENTMLKHITHLKKVGLLRVEYVIGKHEGSIYEVLLPEEIPNQPNQPNQPKPTQDRQHNATQKVVPDQPQNIELVGLSKLGENIESYANSKTLLRINRENIDDEHYRAAFSDLERVLNETVENLTGRETNEADRGRWKQVADILAAQLELIASRTTISNAPAVLAEHLHRQLNSKRALERMGLIAPSQARAEKEAATQESNTSEEAASEETIADLYLCPDCDGTTYWNPDGKGRQPGCPHPRLAEARERAALEH